MCHQMWCGHPKSHLDYTGRMIWHSQWLCPPSHIRLVPILQLGELGGWCMMKKRQALVGLDLNPSQGLPLDVWVLCACVVCCWASCSQV